MKFILVGACPICHFASFFPNLGIKNCYNLSGFVSVQLLWIELYTCYCSKGAGEGQEHVEKNAKKIRKD